MRARTILRSLAAAALALVGAAGCVSLNKDAVIALTSVVNEAEGQVEIDDPMLKVVVHLWDVGMDVSLENVSVSGSASGGEAPSPVE